MINSIKKILNNEYIFSIITKSLMLVIGFFHTAICARYLGPELKGLSAYITGVVTVWCIIITCGMHEAYPFFRKKNHTEDFCKKYMNNIITLYVFLLLVSVGISIFFVKVSFEVVVCIILTPLYAYQVIVSYVSLIEMPNLRNKSMTVICIIDLIFTVIIFLFTKSNLFWAVLILVFSNLFQAIYFTAILKIKYDIKDVSIKYILELSKFGFLPMIALLLTSLNYRLDIIMLRWFDNVNLAEIGIYSVAITLAEKALLIPNAVKEILLSKLTKEKGVNEVVKTMKLCFPISLLIALLIFCVGKFVIVILYGIEFQNAYGLTVISLVGVSFTIYLKMISTYNVVHGKQKTNLKLLIICNLINFLLNLSFIPKFGVYGAAYASTISYFICGIMFLIQFTKCNNISLKNVIIIEKEDIVSIKSKIFKSR